VKKARRALPIGDRAVAEEFQWQRRRKAEVVEDQKQLRLVRRGRRGVAAGRRGVRLKNIPAVLLYSVSRALSILSVWSRGFSTESN